jgi:hypothetical protein
MREGVEQVIQHYLLTDYTALDQSADAEILALCRTAPTVNDVAGRAAKARAVSIGSQRSSLYGFFRAENPAADLIDFLIISALDGMLYNKKFVLPATHPLLPDEYFISWQKMVVFRGVMFDTNININHEVYQGQTLDHILREDGWVQKRIRNHQRNTLVTPTTTVSLCLYYEQLDRCFIKWTDAVGARAWPEGYAYAMGPGGYARPYTGEAAYWAGRAGDSQAAFWGSLRRQLQPLLGSSRKVAILTEDEVPADLGLPREAIPGFPGLVMVRWQ